MRAFVTKIFFQTFDALHTNERAKISRHQCKTRRKFFDIIRFFKNKNNYNEKLTQKIAIDIKCYKIIYKMKY